MSSVEQTSSTGSSLIVASRRRLPVGAEVQPDGGVHFRVWAPRVHQVALLLAEAGDLRDAQEIPLVPETAGYFSALVATAQAGMHYRYRLERGVFPDPASRFQPGGPHSASLIVDPSAFEWTDDHWPGVKREGQVIYELHVGTFTPEGTWAAAAAELPYLADLGVTLLEIMPVAEFPGQQGWGYDGVDLFAPTRLYGSPDDFRAFVDRAHAVGLGVLLDVVYNHLGPDGNYLREFSEDYFHATRKSEWGDALNFDGESCDPVREFFIANAGYWIDEFHIDGLRLDATNQIFDTSKTHLLEAITDRVRQAGGKKSTYLVGENEPQDAQLIRTKERGGFGMDALWNDDFHHTAIVALTGRDEAYYTDYHGSPQEFISATKWGFLYQGQRYKWQQKRRGSPSFDLAPENFVVFLQNHDQIANSLAGRRIHRLTSAGRLRALTALLLLGPNTPMLFQGQEFAASAPFLYFADHHPELAKAVAKGRAEFLQQFPSIAAEDSALLPDPEAEDTFLRCKLDHSEREKHPEILRLHRDLLRLRREDPLLGKSVRGTFDGAVLGPATFALRFFGHIQEDRLLIVNLGPRLHLDPAPDPLLSPPSSCIWTTAWSSEDPLYGGGGTPPVESDDNWWIPAEAAVLLTPNLAL